MQAQISDQQAVLAADRLDPGVPLATSLHILDIPPTVRLPAVVRHLLAKEEGLLSDSVSEGLGLPKAGQLRFACAFVEKLQVLLLAKAAIKGSKFQKRLFAAVAGPYCLSGLQLHSLQSSHERLGRTVLALTAAGVCAWADSLRGDSLVPGPSSTARWQRSAAAAGAQSCLFRKTSSPQRFWPVCKHTTASNAAVWSFVIVSSILCGWLLQQSVANMHLTGWKDVLVWASVSRLLSRPLPSIAAAKLPKAKKDH